MPDPIPPSALDWPGKRLGLPQAGPRSVARLGRRLLALLIDWGAAVLISVSFFDYEAWATLGVFAVVQISFLLTAGGSPGHLLVGLRLVSAKGGYVSWWRPVARTGLLCLVIPAVIWDRDQRGLHDRWIGTVLVRR